MQKLTEDERMALTRNVMDMLDDWGLQAKDMMSLLQLPANIKTRNLGRFRDDTPFPDDPNVMKRVHYLMRIAEALRTTHPRSPQMGQRWMRQSNPRLGRRSPLAVMIEGGESGLVAVLSQLDCTFAWDRSGSKGA